MRTDDALGRAGEPRQVGLGADDREGAAIDLRALADVVEGRAHGAVSRSARRRSPRRLSARTSGQ